MVSAAERNGELIADLAAERSALRKPEMMGICRPPAANQARMLGDKSDMLPVTHPAGFRHRQRALIDRSRGPAVLRFCLVLVHSSGKVVLGVFGTDTSVRPQGLPASLGKLSSTTCASAAISLFFSARIRGPTWQRHRLSQVRDLGDKSIAQLRRRFGSEDRLGLRTAG